MAIRIFIAEDHVAFRKVLRSFLENEKKFKVIGEASDSDSLLKSVKKQDIDILTLDINMPTLPVVRVIKNVLKIQPDIGIVILTMNEDEFYVKEVFKAGARAYIIKKSCSKELITAIKAVHKKLTYIDSSLSNIKL